MNRVSVADNAGRGVDGDGDWGLGSDISLVASLVIVIVVICEGVVRVGVGRWWDRGKIGMNFVRLMEQGVKW